MAQKRGTRKLRKGGGWFTRNSKASNGDVKRAAELVKSKIKEANARESIIKKAGFSAGQRSDYRALMKKNDELILQRKKAMTEQEEIKEKQKRIINEEIVKQADQWERAASKKGWFS